MFMASVVQLHNNIMYLCHTKNAMYMDIVVDSTIDYAIAAQQDIIVTIHVAQ